MEKIENREKGQKLIKRIFYILLVFVIFSIIICGLILIRKTRKTQTKGVSFEMYWMVWKEKFLKMTEIFPDFLNLKAKIMA